MKVRQEAIEAVGHRRVDRASRLVGRSEHEVVDQELGAAVEELGQGAGPVVGVEPVVLLDRDPRQLAALARQLVRHPGVLLLALEQLVTSGLPLLTADNLCDPSSRLVSFFEYGPEPAGLVAARSRRPCLCLCRYERCRYERRVLALECLDRTAAPARGQGL